MPKETTAKTGMTLNEKKAKVYDLSVTLDRMKQSFQMQVQPMIAQIKKIEAEIQQEEAQMIQENAANQKKASK